jgi:hypothetical protein
MVSEQIFLQMNCIQTLMYGFVFTIILILPPKDVFQHHDEGENEKKPPLPESASGLYRPSDCRLSAKLVSAFADRGCHVVSVTDPYGRMKRNRKRKANRALSSNMHFYKFGLKGVHISFICLQ